MVIDTSFLSPGLSASLIWILALLIADYVSVSLAIAIDLVSGVAKSRREGRRRTSRGYRQSVDKALRYFFTLLALSVIDALIVTAALLLRSTVGWSVPAIPLFTTIGAIALCIIEAKSVMENARHRTELTDTAHAIADALSDPAFQRLIDSIRALSQQK